MLEQYKILHTAILNLTQETIDNVQQVEGNYVYTFNVGGDDQKFEFKRIEGINVNVIAAMIRAALALHTFGVNYDGFTL